MASGASTAIASHSVARLKTRMKKAMRVRKIVVNRWMMEVIVFLGAPDSWMMAMNDFSFISRVAARARESANRMDPAAMKAYFSRMRVLLTIQAKRPWKNSACSAPIWAIATTFFTMNKKNATRIMISTERFLLPKRMREMDAL